MWCIDGPALWSLATLGWHPRTYTWASLAAAAARTAPEMNEQNVANALWAYATLGRMPNSKDVRNGMADAFDRLMPLMNAQGLSNAIWAGGN